MISAQHIDVLYKTALSSSEMISVYMLTCTENKMVITTLFKGPLLSKMDQTNNWKQETDQQVQLPFLQ